VKSLDFEYDKYRLSDFGFIMCKFDEDGIQTISNGSQITFNTVSTLGGSKHEFVSTSYKDCLEGTFQICKSTCENHSDMEISVSEFRELMSWLNRKGFYKFKFIDDEYLDIFFEVSFNVSRIEVDEKLIGLELKATTNRPYGLLEPVSFVINNMGHNTKGTILDDSDEEGFIYPDTEITIKESGDLIIRNSLDNKEMRINNCIAGEVIKLNYPLIESSIASHKIQNDFNWEFLKVINKYRDKRNSYTISIPCVIKITYSPIVKMGL